MNSLSKKILTFVSFLENTKEGQGLSLFDFLENRLKKSIKQERGIKYRTRS